MTTETYRKIWDEWIFEIEKIIPKTHSSFNLIKGISESDLKRCQGRMKVVIPDSLADFYKAYDVKKNADISVFSFEINGYWYTLIPFKCISEVLDDLEEFDFFDAEDIAVSYKDIDISDRIIIEHFTNDGWIPFAQSDQGDYLMFDTNPSDKGIFGQIIELQGESWERNLVADSLEELVKIQIKKLQNGDVDILKSLLAT